MEIPKIIILKKNQGFLKIVLLSGPKLNVPFENPSKMLPYESMGLSITGNNTFDATFAPAPKLKGKEIETTKIEGNKVYS